MWPREIDSNYKGKEFQYIRRHYYDDDGNATLYAETHVGTIDNDIYLHKQTILWDVMD